ncbi:hypothetical protein SENE111051_13635 [Serratia nematodiphila]|uniref:MarR family transcriptional regulator n=1 Tax=Serratia nematodiphila TaxID=458197 RepID=A0A1G5KGH2_9GAMM|nr:MULTISPECIES: hypothetical protein [Serratia]ANM78327.1 hypothetical protein A4U88_0218 [Serratia marcescens]MDP8825181.1 hypothetical protein [Serratia marcescens]UTO00379.1 hypothetical protein NLX84_18580 [Serratia nematodiphila]SCY99657.1 hypothetical protein SAMN02927935_03392 [Serratia nematodiphila]HDU7916458.1 hypothetical protein [Serratia marcescens]
MIQSENKLLQDVVSTLESILEARIKKWSGLPGDDGIDCVLEVRGIQGVWIMPVEVKKQAYPRDIRQAIWRIEEFCQKNANEPDIVPIFVAELISEGAREMLKKHDVGYYEMGGTLFIKHKQSIIDIQKPRKRAAKRGSGDLFTGAREMVVHALLQSKGKWFSGEELSERSGTSAYTVSGVLRELEMREWLDKTSEGGRSQRRRLVNPGALLNAWSEATRQRENRALYGYLFAPDAVDCVRKIERKVSHADGDINWVLTGALPANQATPLLTGVNVAEIIVPLGSAELFTQLTGIKRAEKGYNVVVHECAPAALQFINYENNIPVASDFIQYLSLLDGKGRNAELAEQFRREILEI